MERIAARLRNQQLPDEVMTYRRLLLHLITVYDCGNHPATVKSILDPNRNLLDAIHLELSQYL